MLYTYYLKFHNTVRARFSMVLECVVCVCCWQCLDRPNSGLNYTFKVDLVTMYVFKSNKKDIICLKYP